MMDDNRADARYLILELPDQQPEGEAAEYRAGGLTGDHPAREDLLGVQQYADALAQFVRHPDTQPLVIGIHGPWGKGKSTFMDFVESALKEDIDAAAAGVVTVKFNAWRFQDSQQIWAGLASTITERLEAYLSPWDQIGLWRRNAWERRRGEILSFGFALAIAVLIALLAVFDSLAETHLLPQFVKELLGTDDYLKLGLGGGAAALILVWRLPQLLQPTSQRILEYGRLPDYRNQMGYQYRVLDDIGRVHKALKDRWRRQANVPVRVVVFIDDLDRCSEEKIVEILQAINLILGASEFFVFVGVASEMLQRAIRIHYKQDDEELDEEFPQKYLEKIIQISFRLPAVAPEKQTGFIEHLFSESTRNAYRAEQAQGGAAGGATETPAADPDADGFRVRLESLLPIDQEIGSAVATVVQDTPHELRAFVDLHRFLEDNPRVKKHVVNIHRLVKILLQEPGVPWSRERQRQLVVWLIFCHCWPRNAQQILDLAGELKDADDILRAWREISGTEDPTLDTFIGTAKQDLPGQDFVEDGLLRQAMLLSRMATTFKADDEPIEVSEEPLETERSAQK